MPEGGEPGLRLIFYVSLQSKSRNNTAAVVGTPFSRRISQSTWILTTEQGRRLNNSIRGGKVTLAVVFLRRARSHYELVFGSDSRLTGGQANDQAQKIFQLPRDDGLFAFAGDTQYAYPLMMQMLDLLKAILLASTGSCHWQRKRATLCAYFNSRMHRFIACPSGRNIQKIRITISFLAATIGWTLGTVRGCYASTLTAASSFFVR